MSKKHWSLTHRQHLEVLHTMHSLIIKHLFNYSNKMQIYSLHIFTVFLLHVSVLLTPPSGRTLCPLLKTTQSSTAILYDYDDYSSYVRNIKGTACIYWSYNNFYIVDHRCCTTHRQLAIVSILHKNYMKQYFCVLHKNFKILYKVVLHWF